MASKNSDGWAVLIVIGLLIFGCNKCTQCTEEMGDTISNADPKVMIRQDSIEGQFSAWDGSHILMKKAIKKHMRDPDSFDHIETVWKERQDHIEVTMSYRGANAFGGKVVEYKTAHFGIDGRFIKWGR